MSVVEYKMKCGVCGNTENNTRIRAREMMFGLRDEFDYFKCNECGCLQIASIPEAIEKYYPDNYYSYDGKHEQQILEKSLSSRLKRGVKNILADYYLKGSGYAGRKLFKKFKAYYPWLKEGMVSSRSKILDVGCGGGELLLKMYNNGFRNLTGVDPYISEDIHYECGVTIYKKHIKEMSGGYDLIMLHHAFEHMDHPLTVLKDLHSLCNPGGMVIIRIPIVDSFAWEKYGADWVQLDAPRHFFLHTRKSMQLLAKQSGFDLRDVEYDSWELQFYGSEKYRKDIPLVDKREIFTPEEMDHFKKEAELLNKQEKGDSACFYLYKK